ncbi:MULTISPECIES: hypothetical protein [Paenibacillus]|jgi:hypothetical protein|uniref:hypothetical protein n=1 Tax=Paenibacillus TaxID=44249 RepID=UPI000315EB75|nr:MULTISPECIES: hypothetical protein [Paenibacillus]AJW69352.1 hypothetical protein PPE_06475 [Paenibacillus polymyxa E681]QNV59336.1 hypothetical protein GE561_04564 [Paenibacillus polymyxa E681]QNV64162.1 hypothetical protein GMA19_04553 [Paenibacillus polymyxa E681]QYK69810.1 hypothetical protein KAI36_05018 [Paenibacillus sp. S02]WCM61051.1 hypothetical protein OYT09_24475 [Paenibacillus polymyxa]
MNKVFLLPLLLAMLFMYLIDRKSIRDAPAVNRWISRVLYVISIGIWIYGTSTKSTVYVATWLARFIDMWLPPTL